MANPSPIRRCLHRETKGKLTEQCRLTDPHNGAEHWFGIDFEYGRDLDTASPVWLAAQVRTLHAQVTYHRNELATVTAVALDLDPAEPAHKHAPETMRWLARQHARAAIGLAPR